MRPQPIRRAVAGSIPVALRSRASLRNVFAAALAAAVGFAPAILIASPAAAAASDYTIADESVDEGGTLTFTITRAGKSGGQGVGTVTYTTSVEDGDTATEGTDYTAKSAVASFPSTTLSTAQTVKVSVPTTQDSVDEADETFTVTLSAATGVGQLTADTTATGTIVDDDNPTYTLSSSPTTVNESAAAENRRARITAKLNKASTQDIVVPVSTKDGTAKAAASGDDEDGDYTPLAADAEITIEAGDTTGYLDVPVLDDNIDEASVQDFMVTGGVGRNVTGTGSVTVNIADNDAAPVVKLTAPEGPVDEGQDITVPVVMTGRSEKAVTVKWDTADGPTGTPNPAHGKATADKDYKAVSGGTVTFPALATEPDANITVETLADDLDELSPEDLSVKLSAPTNASLGSPSAVTAGITDVSDVDPPDVTLAPTTVTEGAAATVTPTTFTVKLSKPSGQTQKVGYVVRATDSDDLDEADATAGIGVATVVKDFKVASGTLTFEAGEVEKTFTVDVIGDNIDEDNGEYFDVVLTDAIEADDEDEVHDALGGTALGTNQITITDDDNKPTLTLTQTNVTMAEGDGLSAALLTVKLSNPSTHEIGFDVANALGGTASDGGTGAGSDDYELEGDGGVIAAGKTSSYALVLINGDEVYEADETAKFTVKRIDDDIYATGAPITATLTIKNDDKAPVLTVTPVSGTEGATVAVKGVVTNIAQADVPLSVTFAGASVAGSDAAEPEDFTNPGTVPVTIPGGTDPGTVLSLGDVKLTDDAYDEPNETVVVSGSGFAGVGSVVSGAVTIVDNDEAPVGPPTLMAPPYRQGVGSLDLTGKTVANADVELWAAPYSGGSYAKVATTKADAQGNYTFTRNFTTMGYRFQTMSGGLKSAERAVWLRHDPVLVANSPGKGALTMKVTGDPKLAGLTVIYQWLNPATQAWEKIDPAGKTSASGLAIKNITGLKSGVQYAVRGYIVGDESMGLQGGYTGTRRVVVQ